MKDWKNKFKKRAVSEFGDNFGKDGLHPKTISLDSLTGREENSKRSESDSGQEQNGSYLDRIFEESFSGQDNADEETIENTEAPNQDKPDISDKDALFVDYEGATEGLMNLISEKGYLDIADVNNFGDDDAPPLKPFKLVNTPLLNPNQQDVDGKSVVAVFQEYRKPKFMAIFSFLYLVVPLAYGIFLLSFKDLFGVDYQANNNIIFLTSIGLFLVFLAVAMHMHYKRVILTIELDPEKNAVVYADGSWTSFEPEYISEFQLYYHPHGIDQYGIPFLHLRLETEEGRILMISGQIPEGSNGYIGRENLYPFFSAENLQALGGAYVIEQMAKMLRNAKGCKEITSPMLRG